MKRLKGKPILSIIILSLIVMGCLFAELIMNHDPVYMDLANFDVPPGKEFFFGTDNLGRDIFSMIWYGGRITTTPIMITSTISML